MAYPFSSVESDWADDAELKCLIDVSDKHSACPCKVAVLVTYFTKLLACKLAGKRNTRAVTMANLGRCLKSERQRSNIHAIVPVATTCSALNKKHHTLYMKVKCKKGNQLCIT